MNYGESDVIDHLPPSAWRQLQTFITQAPPSTLRRQDWQTFYHFVQSCHSHQAPLTKESLLGLLLNNGFSHDAAEELGSLYLHGRGLLAAATASSEGNGEMTRD